MNPSLDLLSNEGERQKKNVLLSTGRQRFVLFLIKLMKRRKK